MFDYLDAGIEESQKLDKSRMSTEHLGTYADLYDMSFGTKINHRRILVSNRY